jgi:hypothetical protein
MAPLDVRIRVAPLDRALADLYPDREPYLFGAIDELEPLRGVAVFAHPEGHHHYVSIGLRDAGSQVELTFRLATRGDEPAPSWPAQLLAEFARHALRRRRPFGSGHYLCLPRAIDPDGLVRCGVLVPDPELPTGAWLQIVGLHERELRAVSGDGYLAFLDALRARGPLFVTSPSRAPLA